MPGTDPEKILPTVGLNVGRMHAHQAPLIFWDLGGQAGLRSIWDKYYAESHAIVYVVDSGVAQRPSDSNMHNNGHWQPRLAVVHSSGRALTSHMTSACCHTCCSGGGAARRGEGSA